MKEKRQRVSQKDYQQQRLTQFANALMRERDVDLMLQIDRDTPAGEQKKTAWGPPRPHDIAEILPMTPELQKGARFIAFALYHELMQTEMKESVEYILSNHRETLAIQRTLYEGTKKE